MMTACLLHNEPTSCTYIASLSTSGTLGVAKASLNRAEELYEADAKPGDLPMGRLKFR